MTSKGFSLIEILVSIALLSIMSGIGVSLYAIVNNSYSRANSISTIQSRGSSVMEEVERNIRSAIEVTTSPANYTCPNTVDQCLSLTMPSDSIAYQTSGGNCSVVEYDWIKPSLTTNGELLRAWKNADGSSCGNGSTDLFNTDTTKGISVELVNGQTGIFSVTSLANSPSSVVVAINLKDGVALSAQSRSQVPFITTISLRNY